MNHAQFSVDSGHAAALPIADGINGGGTPELTVSNGVNGIEAALSANPTYDSNSPDADSPATPVSSAPAPHVKIDYNDYQEQESDVRHEPMPFKHLDSDVSVIPQVGTPVDAASLPIHAPTGTPPPPLGELLHDVKMAESNGVNGNSHANGDVDMGDETPTPTPGVSAHNSMSTFESSSQSPYAHSPTDDDDHGRPPPAKRARMHSDADKASLAHSATPPPASAAASHAASPAPPPPSSVPPSSAGLSTLSSAQFRFCQSTVRTLKKLKDAGPFLHPVDPVALNIPHYPSIIKTPMDFSTIERKLASSNPAKLDPNPSNPRYYTAEEFVADVRLIFANTLTFNGPDHVIVQMGKRVEEVFDKQIKHMPANVEPKPPVKKASPPPPPPPPVPAPSKKTVAARRPSTSIPTIRRNDQEAIGRPKREIHPPPPKDLPYAEPPKKSKKSKRAKDDGTAEQLRFCSKLLADMHRKQHYDIANHFYEPVDWVKMELPSYPKIVKKPMDMLTMRKKLDNHEYLTAQKFHEDFKLMIKNCFAFNPAGTLVNMAGAEMQRLFDQKWKNLPPLHAPEPSDDEEEEDESELERQRAIQEMETQIETMRGNLEALKGSVKPVKKEEKRKKEKAPVASTSKATPKPPKPSKKSSSKKKPIPDDDVLTFEQKKDLSESIGKLDGQKLEKVIQIIHEGVPEIRDSTEEIELEIDLLPAAVLTKLYNFVLRPLRQTQTKRSRTGKGTGTGGLKRKSMDEDVEAEKIRQLEQRMALFDQGASGASHPPPRREVDSDHSSDSSSEDSSGSDSE